MSSWVVFAGVVGVIGGTGWVRSRGLFLRLLVHRQDRGVLGRGEVDAHDVAALVTVCGSVESFRV
ncbi:hypothetical protein [Streptomyces sp. NPDC020597]|uniref:hypothetical protein n=1 Tax=unclassified Streptomyces TaxID=2593676 RepID=UPI0037A3DF4D